MYVYNPSNFNVNYANSSNNANTLKGVDVHSSLTNGASDYLNTGSAVFGRSKNAGYGWSDWYFHSVHTGSIYAEKSGFTLWGRTNDLNLHCINTIHLWNNVQYHGAFNAASSRKYKKNIIDITEENAEAVLQLNPVEFDYKDSDYHSYGLIAEDTYKILPQIVSLKNGEPDSIDYIKLIPFLLKKIQMQQKAIDKLTTSYGYMNVTKKGLST